ncbi:MAG: twin-arginine translocation signal domain-containing protein, partial [Thermoanaerobaculia bacterium]
MSRIPRPEVSRRDFVASAAAAAAGLALTRWANAQALTGCDYMKAVADNWGIVRPMLASRYHRLQHVLFHYIRNSWDKFSPQQQQEITRLQWGAPRASMVKAKWDTRTNRSTVFWSTNNGSGNDFLFFHRWMIQMVDDMFRAQRKPVLETWSDTDTIPAPGGGCIDELVPGFTPRFEDPATGKPIDIAPLQRRVEELKQPQFYWSK